MGLVLDSSVLIAAERVKRPVSQLLAALSTEYWEAEFLLSSITVMELEHGWHRANTPEIAAKRRRYLDEVMHILPVEPFTREMAILAAKIDAEMLIAGVSHLAGGTKRDVPSHFETRLFPSLKRVARGSPLSH